MADAGEAALTSPGSDAAPPSPHRAHKARWAPQDQLEPVESQ